MQGQDLGDISEPLLNKYSKKTVNVSKFERITSNFL